MNPFELFNYLQQDSAQEVVVLTPNQRLCAHLQQQYQQWQLNQHKQAWAKPNILPLTSWLEHCWHTLQLTTSKLLPQLLNSHQEHAFWQYIISQNLAENDFVNLPANTELAQRAAELIQQWQLPFDAQTFSVNQNTATFYKWALCYRTACRQNNLIDSTQLPKFLQQHFQTKIIRAPKQLIMACFEEVTPQIQQLLNSLIANGTHVDYFENIANMNEISFSSRDSLSNDALKIIHNQPKIENAHCYQTSFSDITAEITASAQWAKSKLAEGNSSIGIVVPNLSLLRTEIERIYRKILPPSVSFNISAGLPLSECPIIFSALMLLQLIPPEIDFNAVNLLLRTPFCYGSETETHQRALLFARLRRLNTTKLDLNLVISFASKRNKPYYCPLLATSLIQIQQQLPLKQLRPSDWSKQFSQLLHHLGWPGDRTIDSEEYQTVIRWHKLLSEFASLDLVLTEISYSAALSALQRLAQSTLFQPQSQPAAVNILGLLESAGLTFQSMWILGLDNETWPATAKPNPFIPFNLQCQYQLPHSTASRELYFSQQLMQRFTRSAQQIIFSYHQMDGDRLLQASPLIVEFTPLTLKLYSEQEFNVNTELESIMDDYGPAISTAEKITGGTFLLKEQAACPFRAFAKFRLNASEPNTATFGFSGAQRGTLLHYSLEKCWQTIQNHETLCRYSETELIELVSASINEAIHQMISAEQLGSFWFALYQIEKQRLTKLLLRWLEFEKTRPPFRIAALEHAYTLQFGDITLHMRIDRIDEIANGKKLVIDYKTQINVVKDWFGPRPTEPQLPLYCLAQEDIVGFSFAYLRSEKMGFNGISVESIEIQGIQSYDDFYQNYAYKLENVASNWQTQKQHWQQTFMQLAEQLSQGYAAVAPKEPYITCQYCELNKLCRIAEHEDA